MQTEQTDPNQGRLPGPFHLNYPLLRGSFDEMVTQNGSLRPHWEELIESLSTLPPAEMASRWERGRRLIRENGVTYNVYGDPRGLDRPWELDPLPFLMPAQEWRAIEAAVTQRAMLFNHVLADLYGPQTLVSRGLLPPALVYGHPGFLRPCHNANPRDGVYLHVYAADLARGPDGRWQVIADRSEAPSGAGYALENRIIISRILPEFFRSTQVERLAPFFQKLRDTLLSLSPRRQDNPRIVLLTPGPYNETYFEHAYLARYLGYTLVESEDLTVRDNRVYLKTLDGLQPVDVILRRTDAPYCDPLELRGDSSLGIAGLVQAVRAGNVTVANALGSGLLETSAIMAFLPSLCRHFLGEDLAMPSASTWWCGQPFEREHVISHLPELVIKPTFQTRRMEPVFGSRLDAAARAALAERIRRAPHEYVAQDMLPLSKAPIWIDGQLEPRSIVLRVFLTAHDGGYTVMPGGLTRVSPERGLPVVSMQRGGGSKDTWVLSDNPVAPVTLLRPQSVPVKLTRGSRDLPSRVADNMFWLGRYVERCEDITRLLRTALARADHASGGMDAEGLTAVLDVLRSRGIFPAAAADEDSSNPIRSLTDANFTDGKTGGLHATVGLLHRIAFLVRDRLSVDTWRAVQRLQQEIHAIDPARHPAEVLTQLNGAILTLEALSGLAMENMTRGLGWRFYDIGRRQERAIHVVDLLSGILLGEDGDSSAALDVLLEISDSVMTYRSRYLSSPQFAPVLDLLMADESNPRSVAFQLAALSDHMDKLAASRTTPFFGPEQRIMIALLGAIRTADIEFLSRPDEDGARHALGKFLEIMRSRLWELSETVTRQYFTHAARKRQSPAGDAGQAML